MEWDGVRTLPIASLVGVSLLSWIEGETGTYSDRSKNMSTPPKRNIPPPQQKTTPISV